MTATNLIVPPPELFTEWLSEAMLQHDAKSGTVAAMVADKAAQWGADHELEACCEWLENQTLCVHRELIPSLRRLRRPKPPSLKEQALAEVAGAVAGGNITPERGATIRRALEALDD